MGQGGYFNPWHSRWIDTLFSSWHGFLSWTPVAYVAVVGTFAYLRRSWRWAASALVILFLTAWVNGATLDWAGGWSFGGRRFSSALVMLAPGLAVVIEFVLRRPLLALAPVLAGAIWWNHLLMVQYTAGMLPKDEPVSFGRIVRQQAELQTRSPYWYPFAFPANVWFAWREGVPVDKYDVLSPETPRATFSLVFDRTAEKYLLSGWDVPGGDDWGPAWWIGGSPALMAVPLDLPGQRCDDHDPVAHAIRGAAGRRGDRARCERRRSRPVQGGRAGCIHCRDHHSRNSDRQIVSSRLQSDRAAQPRGDARRSIGPTATRAARQPQGPAGVAGGGLQPRNTIKSHRNPKSPHGGFPCGDSSHSAWR